MQTVVEIKFDAADVPGGADAILSRGQCEKEVVKVARYEVLGRIDVTLRFDENDARVPKVLALLADASATAWVDRRDIYTEDDLQAARLLEVSGWWAATTSRGLDFGTTYDRSQACLACGTGVRQTSPLISGGDDMRKVDKHRIAGTSDNDLLVRDTDVERLIAAKVTGANFWPAYFKEKSGNVTELRWQQALIESVLPPMAASSYLDHKGVCPTCGRGGFTTMMNQPTRLVYRAEDLANVQDFNLTWESFGEFGRTIIDGIIGGERWSRPWILVTPKVMNLLRGKTKKELKYQGCDFIPIWIEGEADQPKSPSR
jgi:hypothetical protein